MRMGLRSLLALATLLIVNSSPAGAQQQKKLRPLRIALPSHTIAGTHFYVGKTLGIFEHYGFDRSCWFSNRAQPSRH